MRFSSALYAVRLVQPGYTVAREDVTLERQRSGADAVDHDAARTAGERAAS